VAVVEVGRIWNFIKEIGSSHARVDRGGVNYTPAPSVCHSTGGSLFGLAAPTFIKSLAPVEAGGSYVYTSRRIIDTTAAYARMREPDFLRKMPNTANSNYRHRSRKESVEAGAGPISISSVLGKARGSSQRAGLSNF